MCINAVCSSAADSIQPKSAETTALYLCMDIGNRVVMAAPFNGAAGAYGGPAGERHLWHFVRVWSLAYLLYSHQEVLSVFQMRIKRTV
jgi:hypothetical protein